MEEGVEERRVSQPVGLKGLEKICLFLSKLVVEN